MQERARARFPSLAAALSFLFPGLGQAYARQPTVAAMLAIPIGVLIVAAVLAATLLSARLRNAFFSPQFLTALLVLNAVLLLWRLFAILHAGLARPGAHRRPWEVAIVVVLVAATIGMHAWTGVVIGTLDNTLRQVFTGSSTPIYTGGAANQQIDPSYRWDGTSRVSLLLIGIDGGAYRSSDNTDTILVVSIDPLRHTAVMVSVPRDTGWMPLPDRRIYADGRYPQKINSLADTATKKPALWCPNLPAAADCGIRMLEQSVGLYLGININYYATLNISGFAHLIDAIGGVRMCLTGTLTDHTYGGPTWYPRQGIILKAGCQVLDGPHAVAYARIRYGTLKLPNGTVVAQDDFSRAARQQEILLALRDQFAASNWVFALPSLLQAVGETVSSDFPRDQAGNLASLLPLISGSHVTRVVLSRNEFATVGPNPDINYLLIPKREVIRTEMQSLFGADGPLKGWYLGSTAAVPPATGT